MHVTARRFIALVLACAVPAGGLAACGDDGEDRKASAAVTLDGSVASAPFARVAARRFRAAHQDTRVVVGTSGAAAGFERLCAGETDLAGAARAMDADEAAACRRNGVDFVGVQVANDAVAIVTHPRLKIECLSTRQLGALWRDRTVENYEELGSRLPDQPVRLFGSERGSDTLELFTAQITGKAGRTRSDYQPAGEDAGLARAVAGHEAGLGYAGLAAYAAGQDRLNLVAVDAGSGCVRPSPQSVQDGSYEPLTRRIFVYASAKALERAEVGGFMRSLVDGQRAIALEARIVPTTDEQATRGRARFDQAMGGPDDVAAAPPASSG